MTDVEPWTGKDPAATLTSYIHDIGRTILPTNPAEAVGWLQKAFSLSECDSENDGSDMGKLKVRESLASF